jgi:hypothetical protein
MGDLWSVGIGAIAVVGAAFLGAWWQARTSHRQLALQLQAVEQGRIRDERRATYARFLRLAQELGRPAKAYRYASEMALLYGRMEEEQRSEVDSIAFDEARERMMETEERTKVALDALMGEYGMVLLLASEKVRASAERVCLSATWLSDALRADNLAQQDEEWVSYRDSIEEFGNAARVELGLPKLPPFDEINWAGEIDYRGY